MKRLSLLALALFLSMFFPLVSSAQETLDGLIEDDDSPLLSDSVPPQRIGVPSSQFNLSSNESGSVGGFCFDEFLIAPRRVTKFQNVVGGNKDAEVRLADGSTITLQEAINRGDVAVRAHQLKLTFTNKTDAPMEINLKHPVVFWDRPGGGVNPMAMKVLESPNEDYDWRQKMVWKYTTSERMLATFGYYDGSVFNIDRDRFRKATEQFQKAHDLEVTGELDAPTMARLSGESTRLQERLAKLGFLDFDRRSIRNDPAAQVRSFQAYLGQPRNGQWSESLDRQLGQSENLIKQVVALRSDPRPVDEALKATDLYPNVVTYLNGPKGIVALVEAPNGVELWSQRGSQYFFEGRNEKAAAKLDDAAAHLAVRASKGENLVIYPRATREKQGAMMVGNRETKFNASGVRGYLEAGDIPTDLAAAVSPFATGGSSVTGNRSAKNVVVYRGPLSQGRLADPKASAELRAKLGLEPIDGAKLANAFDRTYGDKMAIFVSDDLRAGATRLGTPAGQGKL